MYCYLDILCIKSFRQQIFVTPKKSEVNSNEAERTIPIVLIQITIKIPKLNKKITFLLKFNRGDILGLNQFISI